MKNITLLFFFLLISNFGLFTQTNVTFQVDLNQSAIPAGSIPEVNGTFNNWCGAICNPMTDVNGDGIWEAIIALLPGNYEYKFAYNNWAGQEALTPGSSCTITNFGYTNRTLTVGPTAMVLSTVCWNSCAACGVTPPPPTQAQVTFKVDMNQSTMPAGSIPEVNGTFNGWCGSCNAMTDANGDGVWETTILLNTGSYEYKFSYSAWTGQEMLIPGSTCTLTTGPNTNRTLTVGSTALTLPIVCYGTCTACPSGPVLTQMNLPVTFEGSSVDYGVIGFEGAEASTIVADPTNAANTVVKVIKSASAQPWAGTTITAAAGLGFSSPIPFTSTNRSLTLRVWSPDAGIQIRLKVENHSNPTQSVETEATTTVANDWQTLVFNFNTPTVPPTAAFNPLFMYTKASVFMNFAVAGSVTGEKIYYFDDLLMFVPTPPSASVLTGNASICNGSTTNLNIEVTGGSSPYTVTVTDGTSNFTATGTSPVIIPVSPTSTSTYSIVSVDGNGAMGMGNSGTATVTVTPNTTNTISETACDSYTWNGQTYTSSGSFTGETANCITDILNLTITPNSSNMTVATSCESYTWNNTTYTISGTYTGTTTNCITEILDLTISPNLPNTTYETACDSYTWNGQTYDASGIYTGDTTNCGTELLNLTITPSTTNITSISAPGSYTWAENGQTYTASGTYTGSTTNCITQVLNLTITVVLAQMNLPVTFEESTVDYGVIGFEGAEASTIVTDPTNADNTVVKVIKSAFAQPWAGTTITAAAALGFASPVPFSTNTFMSLRVWSPDAGIQVRLKVENHSNPTQSVETEATTTIANGWQTLVFNFANQAPGTAALNLSYQLDKASVFMNFAVPGSVAGEKIYYFDDLMMYVPSNGPSSSTLSGSATICSGDSTNLSVQIVGGTAPYSVIITDGTNNFSSSGNSPVIFTVSPTLTTTTYSIVSVSGGGMGVGNTGTATVDVIPNSINSLTISAVDSYTWPNTGQTYTVSGTYTGTTTNCVTEQLILTISTSSLDDLSDFGISIYPNPSSGIFSITNEKQHNFMATVTDGAGRIINSTDINVQDNTIDISTVSPGIYYVHLSSLSFNKVIRILKN